jgi:DNA primase
MNTNPFEQIRDKLNVVEVLGAYLDLKSNGQNYKACCPFHNEKHASLVISQTKNIWHCFGCGLGGDIFKFVSLYENTDKAGALRILAAKAGVSLQNRPQTPEQKQVQQETKDQKEQGFKMLSWSANIYHQVLLKILSDTASPITQYCRQRGWSMETIVKFQLGYAPRNNFLFNLATQHGIDLNLLLEVGILKDFNGAKKDKFSDRLMVPILDRTNQVVGFTARVLPYESNPDRPKYLNSSQSDWFNKSELWYGQNWHSTRIRQVKKALLVEGNMDVIMASQMGFNYCLASQGTSFTIEQLKQLKFLTSNIWLAFDNDNAGQTASYKLFLQAKKLGFEVYKVIIPNEYKDLDEYLQSEKVSELKTILFLDNYLNQNIHELQSTDSQVQKTTILQVLELISVCDPITREQFLTKLSALTNLSLSILKSELKPTEKVAQIPQQNTNIAILTDNLILASWQSILRYENLQNARYISTFKLLQKIIPSLNIYSDINTYYTENQDEIELINESQNLDQENQLLVWQKIMAFVDKNLNKFIFDRSAGQLYLELKSIDKSL